MASRGELFTLITPSYNQGKFLEETILSVLNQTYLNIEYLIIDGGSTDESVDIIRRYAPKLRYWVSEPDRGQAHAINKGLKLARGEFVGWLNADDTLYPDAVERVAAIFRRNSVDVVYGTATRIDPDGKIIRTPPRKLPYPVFSLEDMIGECLVSQPGAFWRASWIEQVGFLDEELHFVMDYEYWMRLALAGAQFYRLEGRPLANFRLFAGSKTVSASEKSGQETLFILDRLVSNPELRAKINKTEAQFDRQIKRAYGLAYLKIFRAYAQKPLQQNTAFSYLRQAAREYPPVLLEKYKLLIYALYDIFRNRFRYRSGQP